ncbi:ergothioneine biosynthesis protein EgtC [Nocardiopsis kunsanensis]|uniref:Gamma-glutamyl-hercynylcysteine sulfoxide hydrolase n=1 Tax=Nocardiopsis kunsanensis TaxID=141693 RepID=A0A919CE68_9ACTN|nr:ergothioneine biosynthesis protein EgtC [Nocardiopsis kunsanensis]GHD14289.1 gamma-glutamyl-hercynylcysteine sulfoxide hydrolase [Nocardiopsis kunsanensis]
MCRHLAYLGPPRTLHELLYAAPHSLHVQSWAPRAQRHGTVNADGFGAGWYPGPAAPERGEGITPEPESPPEPLRYRRAMPMWGDASFADAAHAITSGCVVAAVRDATLGFGSEESGAQPFRADTLLFSHNGAVKDDGALVDAFAAPPPEGVLDARAPVDSAPLFAHTVRTWRSSGDLPGALATVVRQARERSEGRYNLLASDGRTLAATAAGDTLYTRDEPGGGVFVASEPFDDTSGWREVPDGSLVVATRDGTRIHPIG